MIKPPLNSLIRFRSNGHEATVSEHTTLGFRYVLAHDYPFIPRWGAYFTGEGEVYLDAETRAFWEADIEVIPHFSEWPPASQTFQSITYTITNEA